MKLIWRTPKATGFSVVRWNGVAWVRRPVTFNAGITGDGWFVGFIKYDKREHVNKLPTKGSE